jgi:hypothetical protein
MIRKEDLINFSGDPKAAFEGKVIAVTGEVSEIGGSTVMFVNREEAVEIFGIEE